MLRDLIHVAKKWILQKSWKKEQNRKLQTIAVEATAKRNNSLMLKKTSFENTARFFSQAEEYFMYTPSMSTSNNYDEAEANAAAYFLILI